MGLWCVELLSVRAKVTLRLRCWNLCGCLVGFCVFTHQLFQLPQSDSGGVTTPPLPSPSSHQEDCMRDYGPLDVTRFHTSFITDALWNTQWMTVAFPAIVRKQSRLMTPPPRSHPPIAKRRWTRKGEGGSGVISRIFFIIYTVACYELCCVCVCVFM